MQAFVINIGQPCSGVDLKISFTMLTAFKGLILCSLYLQLGYLVKGLGAVLTLTALVSHKRQ